MDDNKVSVVLAGPAKIGGKREPAGKTVSVTADMARDLDARHLLVAGAAFDTKGVALASDFHEAVELAVAGRLADREVELQASLSKLIAAHAEELAAAVNRADAAETKAAELEAANAGLAETMAKLETSLSAALSRADAAEAKLAEMETAATKSNTAPAEPKQAGKKT